MKKLFFILVALAVSISSFANNGETRLTVSSYAQRNITVSVDGYNRSNGSNSSSFTISDLSGGSHNVKIYEEKRGLFGRTSNKLVYDANLYLRPNYETYLTINNDGRVEVREQALYNNNNTDYGRNNGRGNNDPYNNGYKNKMKKQKKNKHDNRRDHDDWRDNNGGWNNNNGGWNNGNGSYNNVMSSQAFEQFKYSIRNESFENTKQSVAKQGLSTNYFTAAQIKEVTQLFSFDAGKLEIAKYAYNRCVDKGNYYTINDVFSFSSSRDELARYIQSVR